MRLRLDRRRRPDVFAKQRQELSRRNTAEWGEVGGIGRAYQRRRRCKQIQTSQRASHLRGGFTLAVEGHQTGSQTEGQLRLGEGTAIRAQTRGKSQRIHIAWTAGVRNDGQSGKIRRFGDTAQVDPPGGIGSH